MRNLHDDDELVLSEIASLYSDLHGRSVEVRLDSDLRRDLGFDSLAIVELVDRINDAAGTVLAEDVLSSAETPGDLARAVHDASTRAHGPRTSPPGARVREPAIAARLSPRVLDGGELPTLTAALAKHAEAHPDQLTVRLLGTSGEETITYGELFSEAQDVARALIAGGLSFGDRVALMLPTERSYFGVYCGVLLAGGVPVPLYPPPGTARLAENLTRLAGVLRNAGATVLVTVDQAVPAARLLEAELPALKKVVTPRELLEHADVRALLPEAQADDVALIQYTSGSTGDPKGVVLTHAQLSANMRAMATAAELTTDDVVVSWLPLYHDMGLIGVWHTPLVFGVPFVVMSPLIFLARPVRWLEAITSYGGTISAAPNFAYRLCTERIADADLAGLDLSSWRLAFNGSEPVSSSVVDDFTARFAPAGFRPGTMCPAYGLAEAGVGVSFSPLGRGPRVESISRAVLSRSGRAVTVAGDAPGAVSVVGCGYPLPGYDIRIVDHSERELPERHEGRVQCRGPSITKGYFANDRATRALWQHGWLETGDLGYLADGELFLTGRAKDLIIRGGRNLHPEDLEDGLRDIPGIEHDGVAVFSGADVRLGTERLVVVAETTTTGTARKALEETIRRRAVGLVGLPPDEVALVPPGAIQRTPSGKIRRGATRETFERGQLGKPPPPLLLGLVSSHLRPSARQLARACSTWAYGAYAWMVTLLVAAPLDAVVRLPLPLRTRWSAVRTAARAVSKLTGIRVDVEGDWPGHEAPAIVVANHPSFIDAVALILASDSPLIFVTSTDFESKPIIGSFLKRIGCVFVARDEPGRAASDLADMSALVKHGGRLVIFPEGSLANAPGVRPFHLGAFAVAAATGCSIVPVALRGSRGVVPPRSHHARRGNVTVAVGTPVEAPSPEYAAEAAVADTARRAIAQLAGLPLMSAPQS